MDREAWGAAVHGDALSRTRLSHWTDLTLVLCSLPPRSSVSFPPLAALGWAFLVEDLRISGAHRARKTRFFVLVSL